jgi:hypothetical protein
VVGHIDSAIQATFDLLNDYKGSKLPWHQVSPLTWFFCALIEWENVKDSQ